MALLKHDDNIENKLASDQKVNAFLGYGSEFEGKLTFEGSVRIDGKFKGEVFTNDTLQVGEGAIIEAEIEVGTVIVCGQIRGNVTAKKGIEIQSTGKLSGNIATPLLIIHQGALFDGNCRMDTAKKPESSISKIDPPELPKDTAKETM